MSKKLGKPSLIYVSGVSKGCYIISMYAMSNIVQPLLKGMGFTKKNAPHSPSLALFFIAILRRTKQLFDCRLNNVKLKIFNFTYFFQILGSKISFPKIPKHTHTVNIYSEVSGKSRFGTVEFAITSFLWKPDLTFCFWVRSTVVFGN